MDSRHIPNIYTTKTIKHNQNIYLIHENETLNIKSRKIFKIATNYEKLRCILH